MRKILSVVLLGMLMTLLASCFDDDRRDHHYDPWDDVQGIIELNNHSDATIDGFYLSPVNHSSWGPNILERVLYPDRSTDIVDIDPGIYDARVKVTGDYSDYFAYRYDILIGVDDEVSMNIYNSSFTGSLEIYNHTLDDYIIGIYVVPADNSTWGSNQIASDIGPSDPMHLNDIEPGLYDVRIVWDDYSESIYEGINSVEIESLTLTTLNVD